MGLQNVVYVVDYDIPTGNPTRRVDFYRKVHRLLRHHYGKDVKFSTESCYFTEDKELANKFLEVVKKFEGKGHLYRAVKVQEQKRKERRPRSLGLRQQVEVSV